jgi:hypothetical protein
MANPAPGPLIVVGLLDVEETLSEWRSRRNIVRSADDPAES